MTPASIRDLFELVKSLSKSEKRFFKLTASTEDHGNTISRFFDHLEKADILDETYFQKVIRSKSKKVHPHDPVELVYGTILKSQRTFYSDSISGFTLIDEIANLRNLFDKAQYKQCRKMLIKLKEKAYSEESFNFILEIISVEKELLHIESKFGHSADSLAGLVKEEQAVIAKAKNTGEFAQLFSRINYLVRQNMVVKSNKEFEPYDKMLNSALLKHPDKCSTKKSRVLYHHCRALCFSKKRDNAQRYKEFKEMVRLMDEDPFLTKEYPKRYLSAINNILSVEIESARYATAEKLIEKFIGLRTHGAFNTTDLQLKIFTSTTNAQLLIYTDGGKFEKAIAVIRHINEQIEIFKDKINKEELLIFYYNFANLFIYTQNFTEAERYVNFILSENDKLLRQDLQCFSRIQNIIVHFELKKTPQLRYILKTARDFYRDQKFLFHTEKLVLDLFEELLETNSPSQIWQRYLQEFKNVSKDPYEKMAGYYFDFVAYCEGKVSGKKIGDIIFNKQAANWKK
jgi:hypothetical protein